jgi:hypothetical protein
MTQTKEHEEILKEAKERFSRALAAAEPIREHYSKNMRFISGDQWSEQAKRARQDKRPMLVMNRLRTFAAILCGEQRQNEIGGKVIPRGNGANKDTAEILAGKIRDIESESEADVANDKAFKDCIEGNQGWMRVSKEYVSETSFEQKLVIEPVEDSLSIVCDESAVKWDRSDMMYLFKFRDLSKYEFETRYPDADIDPFSPNMTVDNSGWSKGDAGVQVAEYWRKQLEKMKVCLYSNGQTAWKDAKVNPLPPGLAAVGERDGMRAKVEQFIINGCEVLEENAWDGSWIPFIPVIGDERWVDSKRVIFSAISHSHDAQRLVNFYATGEAEAAGLAPLPTWVGAKGQFKSDKNWKEPNKAVGYREYDLINVDGKPLPPPNWESFTPPTEAFLLGKQAAVDDVKATMGMSDALTGQKETDQSGKAIVALQKQGNTANFNFFDNLVRAIRHRTRILVELIPKTYDTAREERIIDKNGKEKMVKFNQVFVENGKEKAYMLAEGDYGVAITVGPSSQTQQEQDSADLTAMAEAAPELFPRFADLYAESHSGPIWERIAKRVKPPDVAEEEAAEEGAEIPPEVLKQEVAKGKELAGALAKQLEEAVKTIESKQVEIQSKEKIEADKIAADLKIESAKLALEREKLEIEREKLALERFKIETDLEKTRISARTAMMTTHENLSSKEAIHEHSTSHAAEQADKDRAAASNGSGE